MFEFLAPFSKILVSGPQRSGTRICAKIISHDVGHRYIDEEDFGVEYEKRFFMFLGTNQRLVIQCPGMCHCIQQFSSEETAIVMMIRAVEDIIASEQRISWSDVTERDKYQAHGVNVPISVLKYQYWVKHQRERIKHAFMVNYEGLSSHPLWIPKEQRRQFRWNQTMLDKRRSDVLPDLPSQDDALQTLRR